MTVVTIDAQDPLPQCNFFFIISEYLIINNVYCKAPRSVLVNQSYTVSLSQLAIRKKILMLKNMVINHTIVP